MKQTQKLSLTDCLMLIMGSMIGSGIFIVPAAMSRELQDPGLLLMAWVATATLTFIAALCYGELAALMPKAGGQYIYLKEAYNPMVGFLYGWTFFTVIQTGTIAAVAVAFAKFSGVFFSFISDSNKILALGKFSIDTQQALAITILWVLTFYNFRSVKSGAWLQNIFTFTKIGALAAVIIAGIWFLSTSQQLHDVSFSFNNEYSGYTFWVIFSVALVGSIFSSDAWNNVTFTGGEIENPKRNLPLSLIIGTGSVLLLYFFINLIYVYALPFSEIQHAPSDRVGTLLLERIVGNAGLYLMAGLIMISTFGCINGLILSGSRVYYAMAKDKLFLPAAQRLNKNNSPQFALTIQAIWTSTLALSGSYSNLLDYVVFAVLLFYILTVGGLILLRIRWKNAERPYKVWLYPVLPIIYILLASFICVNLLIYKPEYTYPGLGIVLLGIPVYLLIQLKNKRL
jgi:APA family basic amino acid/polyamine antiporter